MIAEITLSECENFDPQLVINPTKFNLFIGMNGSGKSILLKHIFYKLHDMREKRKRNDYENEINVINERYRGREAYLATPELTKIRELYVLAKEQIPILIDENRFYDGKLDFDLGNVDLKNIENTTNIAPITPELRQLNEDLKHLFNRTVGIVTDRQGIQTPNFSKGKTNVLTKNDGRGIVNAWTIFEYLSFAPHGFPLFVEEISTGLHPSLLKKYLDRLFQRLIEKDMQLFATSQDPFTAFYFLKNKLKENGDWEDNNPEYSVFSFSDNNGVLCVKKITEENIFSSMNSLMGDFNADPDLGKFNMLFSKPSD